MLCPHGQGGQFFAILCGRPLWTAPNSVSPSMYITRSNHQQNSDCITGPNL